MNVLLRDRVTLTWGVLTVLTLISWMLGVEHGFGSDKHVPASIVIMVVAVFKIRMIGLYFMELQDAVFGLRAALEAYCLILFALLISLYLWG
ncbi:cytochrome C oxidase subunit IV family protein [Mycolicibacterium sp. XJ1819]